MEREGGSTRGGWLGLLRGMDLVGREGVGIGRDLGWGVHGVGGVKVVGVLGLGGTVGGGVGLRWWG